MLPTVEECLEDQTLANDVARLDLAIRIKAATQNSLHNVETLIAQLEAALMVAKEHHEAVQAQRPMSFFARATDPHHMAAAAAVRHLEDDLSIFTAARREMMLPDFED